MDGFPGADLFCSFLLVFVVFLEVLEAEGGALSVADSDGFGAEAGGGDFRGDMLQRRIVAVGAWFGRIREGGEEGFMLRHGLSIGFFGLSGKECGVTAFEERLAEIAALLRGEFAPEVLEVRDCSARHRGHAGYREGVLTHIEVEMVSGLFAGVDRLGRQRMVHRVLFGGGGDGPRENLLDGRGLHSLTLTLRAPGE